MFPFSFLGSLAGLIITLIYAGLTGGKIIIHHGIVVKIFY